ncbi:MAG: hypothetical protein RL095_3773 [Verrucomicrobiota bacterium]|jgi:hypothetical protein
MSKILQWLIGTISLSVSVASCSTNGELASEGGWRQDRFMIAAWGGPVNDVQAAAYVQAGFNTVITKADQLDLCARHGLRSIVTGSTAETAKSLKQHPAVWGWFVRDEPNTKQFVEVAPLVAAFHEADPHHPAYVNLAGWENLEHYFKTVKPRFLSFDVYQWWSPPPADGKERRELLCGELNRHRHAALKASVPLFSWVEANADWRYAKGEFGAGYLTDNAAMLNYSVWLALAHGARGIQWFTGGLVFDKNGRRTRSGNDVAAINRELQILGPVLMNLRCEKVYHTQPVPEKSLASAPDFEVTAAAGRLSFGLFADQKGRRHVIVVNREIKPGALDAEERNVKLLFKQAAGFERFDSLAGKWIPIETRPDGSLMLSLPSGGGALLRHR